MKIEQIFSRLSVTRIATLMLPASLTFASETIELPGGEFIMGTHQGMADERPAHQVYVRAFRLDRSPVSVDAFSNFVIRTHYKTSAERFGNSGVFDMKQGKWGLQDGANWRYPLGPDKPAAPGNHPVTQVSWHDALAYCTDRKGRLPTEAEFEYAAKGGASGTRPTYAFGDKVIKDGDFLVNIWTGTFPYHNTQDDGYLYTAPLGETGITPLGFTDMAGNVWEWSADWYAPYKREHQGQPTEKALRGGSFLCDEDVCHGYRTTARSHSTPETSLMHTGFRCAYDTPQL